MKPSTLSLNQRGELLAEQRGLRAERSVIATNRRYCSDEERREYDDRARLIEHRLAEVDVELYGTYNRRKTT